jgi:galactonate dehydratase
LKIVSVETFYPRRRLRLVRVRTDSGPVGWGEATLEGKPYSTMAAVAEMGEYLVGKDPLRIEDHWQHLYRSAFNRGGSVVMSALAGIDQALWDIAGKHHDVPVYQLLGGPVRDRLRVYAHWGIADLSDEGRMQARERLERLGSEGGYRAFKTSPGGRWRGHEPPAVIDAFVRRAEMMRDWVGPDVELAFDFHGKFTPALAVELCAGLEPVRPIFVEEPVPQENVDALRLVSDRTRIPIATGERLLSRWEFRPVLEKQAVATIQPDVAHAGGISEMRRIAAMAETYYVHVAPHCAIGPVALAACLQVDAAIPNFLIQELTDSALGRGVLVAPWVVHDGFIELPQGPGLGVEVDEKAVAMAMPAYEEELGGEFRHGSDGSVVDW